MSYVNVTYPDPRIAQITLARPDRMNALSMPLTEDLIAALEGVADSQEIAVIVLTGEGRGFCAGGDIKEMHSNRAKTNDQRHKDLIRMHQIPEIIRKMPQLSVGALNGHAYGAGLALALTCDFVIATEAATFGTAFLKQGLVSDFGLSYQLTRLTSPTIARQLILLDKVLTAQEAKTIGLLADIYPHDQLLPEAHMLAAKLAQWPDEVRMSMKKILQKAETATHQEILETEIQFQSRLLTSREHATAVDGFLEN